MADKIRGITIEIGGDTSKLTKSLKDVNSSISSTQKQLKDVDRLLKLDPKNTELLRQKQQLLSKQIEQTKTKVEQLKKVQDEMDAKGIDRNSEQYQALQREIISTDDRLKTLEKDFKNFGSVAAQQIAGVGKELQAVGGKIEGVGQKLKPISAGAAGVEAALVGVGMKAITTADDLATLSQQTGLSTADIQKMQYASELVDVSFEDMTGALTKVKKNMTGQPQLWRALGVSVTNANGTVRDAKEVFFETLVALSRIEDETLRDQVAMQVFGKSADQLAGIIDDGGASLRRFGQEAEDMGLILSDKTIGALNDTNDQLSRAKAQMSAALLELGATVAQVLAPIIEKIAHGVQKVVAVLQSLTPHQLKTIMIIAGIVAVLGPLLILIGKVVTSIGTLLTFVPMIISSVSTIMTAVSGLITFIAANPVVLIIGVIIAAVIALTVIIVKNIDTIKAALAAFGQWISNLFTSIGQGIVNIVQSVVNTVVNLVKSVFGWISSLFHAGATVASSFGGTQFRVGRMAKGGTISSGASLVGENGPELLTMIGGKAQITPLTNQQSQNALSSVGAGSAGDVKVNINFAGSLAQLARVLQPEIQVETNRRGDSLIRA